MEGLFNPTSILLHMLNAAILLTALYFLLYKPVRKFMHKREQGVADALDNVKVQRASLETEKQQAAAEVEKARQLAAETVQKSVTQAQEQAQTVLTQAQENADAMLRQARKEAEHMRETALDDMREEVTDLSVAISAKLLGREVKGEDHEKLIDEFLKKVQPDEPHES